MSVLLLSCAGDRWSAVAGRLGDRLATQFPLVEIAETAELGDAEARRRAAAAAALLLVLVGDRWLAELDDDAEGEIEAALQAGVTVQPVLIDDAELPPSDELPVPLRGLLSNPSAPLRRRHFQTDVAALVSSIRPLVDGPLEISFGIGPDFDVPWAPPAPTERRALIFVSYSHRDEYWLSRVKTHLRPLTRLGRLELWDDRQIKVGDEWRDEIRRALASCSVAVLVISADFMASDFIFDEEVPTLLDAVKARGVRVLPLIASSSYFADSDLARFQSVNAPDRPLDLLSKGEQEAVLESLHKSVRSLLSSAAA